MENKKINGITVETLKKIVAKKKLGENLTENEKLVYYTFLEAFYSRQVNWHKKLVRGISNTNKHLKDTYGENDPDYKSNSERLKSAKKYLNQARAKRAAAIAGTAAAGAAAVGGAAYLLRKRKQRQEAEKSLKKEDKNMSITTDYLKVLSEAGGEKWIQKVHMKKGALHRQLGVPQGEKIPKSKLKDKPGDTPLMRKRKNLAQTLIKIGKKKKMGESLTVTEQKIVNILLSEKEKWIAKAIGKPGSLHKALGVPQGEKIPASKLAVKPGDSPKLKKKKILAKTLKKIVRKKKMGESLTPAESKLVKLLF